MQTYMKLSQLSSLTYERNIYDAATISRQVINMWIQRSKKLYGAKIESNAFNCLDLANLPSLFSGFQVMDFYLRHQTNAEFQTQL